MINILLKLNLICIKLYPGHVVPWENYLLQPRANVLDERFYQFAYHTMGQAGPNGLVDTESVSTGSIPSCRYRLNRGSHPRFHDSDSGIKSGIPH